MQDGKFVQLSSVRRFIDSVGQLQCRQLSRRVGVMTPAQVLSGLTSGASDPLLVSMHEHANAAEHVAPWGFELFFLSLMKRVENRHRVDSADVHLVQSLIEQACRASPNSEVLCSVVSTAVKLAGRCGRIVVETDDVKSTTVNLVEGASFELEHLGTQDTVVEDARVCLIDGVIETVGELHGLLEEAAATQEKLLVVARGFAPDVISTLNYNYRLRRLAVIPLAVRSDLRSLNVLSDIAAVVDSDVVSAHKGQLISAVKLSSCAVLKRATVSKSGKIVVWAVGSSDRIRTHVEFLKKKRCELQHEELQALLDERVKCLSDRTVTITIKRGLFQEIDAHCVDRALRSVSSAIEHGVVVDPCRELQFVPAAALVAGTSLAGRFESLFSSTVTV